VTLRARQRPFVIALVALARFACGVCLAAPLASLVSASGVGLRGEGDRALFEGGGYLLLEVVRLHGTALAAVLSGLLPVLGVGLVLTAFGTATLLVALCTEGPLRSFGWLGRAAARWPALCLVSLFTAIAQGLALLLAALAASGLPEPLTKPVQATAWHLAPWLLAALAGGALGGFADVTKAALVRHDSSIRAAFERALRAARAKPWFGFFGWLPYSAPLLLAGSGVALLTEHIDVSRPGAWRLALVFALHQGVILTAVACRAAWLASALRGVA
jgi:hypothetical protein